MSLVTTTRAALGSVGGVLGGRARWSFAVKFDALASALFLAWAAVVIARDPSFTGVTPRDAKLIAAFFLWVAIVVTSVAAYIHPVVDPALATIRNAHLGLAARASWRVLLLGCAEIAIVVAVRDRGTAWEMDVAAHLLLGAVVWAGLVIAWPVLDAAVVTGIFRGRHATPTEAARVEPLTRQIATSMGLERMPWIAIGSGTTAENGVGASSVVLIGEAAVASWADRALGGLVAHECAHVALGHGRMTPSVALPTGALLLATMQVVSSAMPLYVDALAMVLWLVLLMLVSGPTLYPNEVAADALVVERGYGQELRATIHAFPPQPSHPGALDRFIRWAHHTHPTPEQRLRAIDEIEARHRS